MLSQDGLVIAACVPEREHAQFSLLGRVIHEVPDAAKREPPHSRDACSAVLCAYTGLLRKQCNRFAEVGSDGTGRGQAVLGPPSCGSAELRRGSS